MKEETRACGECRLCTWLVPGVRETGNDIRRSHQFQCLWRRDHEGVMTDEVHRPDLVGVLLTESFDPKLKSDVLYVMSPDKKQAGKASWAQQIADEAQAAMPVVVWIYPDNIKVHKSKGARTTAGALNFFKHKSAARGGI